MRRSSHFTVVVCQVTVRANRTEQKKGLLDEVDAMEYGPGGGCQSIYCAIEWGGRCNAISPREGMMDVNQGTWAFSTEHTGHL